MSDGDTVGFIEEDDEDEEEPQVEDSKPSIETEKETPSSEPQQKVIDLPMTEASDAWMSDGDTVGFIEEDDDDEEEPQVEDTKPSIETEKETPSSEPQQKVIDLPMTEASDAWMYDGDTVGFIEEDDEEEEKPEESKPSVDPEKETPSSEPKQKVIDLPMTEASDAW